MARQKNPEEVLIAPESREEMLTRVKAEMDANFVSMTVTITDHQRISAVSKPDISSLVSAVEFTEDGEPKFKLQKGDKIVIERPYPSRPTTVNIVHVIQDDGYLLMWSDESAHFEGISDWRIAERLGIKLRIPEAGKRLVKVRSSKEERLAQKVRQKQLKTDLMNGPSEVKVQEIESFEVSPEVEQRDEVTEQS